MKHILIIFALTLSSLATAQEARSLLVPAYCGHSSRMTMHCLEKASRTGNTYLSTTIAMRPGQKTHYLALTLASSVRENAQVTQVYAAVSPVQAEDGRYEERRTHELTVVSSLDPSNSKVTATLKISGEVVFENLEMNPREVQEQATR